MDDRLKLLYAEAIRASHTSAFVSVHIGTAVRDYLLSQHRFRPGWNPEVMGTAWGFPVVIESDPDHMSVHVITRIP